MCTLIIIDAAGDEITLGWVIVGLVLDMIFMGAIGISLDRK